MEYSGEKHRHLIDILPYPSFITKATRVIEFNSAAERLFELEKGNNVDISDFWPDFRCDGIARIEKINIPKKDKALFATVRSSLFEDDIALVMMNFNDDKPQVMELTEGYGSQRWLQEKLDALVDILHKLRCCESMDDLYRETVIQSREHLDIDRLGILLIDRERGVYYGTWGTDDHGNLTNESGFEAKMGDEEWVEEAFKSRAHSVFHNDYELKNFGKIVGTGWNAMVNLWKGDITIGWIAADNHLSHRPLTPAVKELLRQLAANLSQIISFKEAEGTRRIQQLELESQITLKTQELNQQYEHLLLVNRRLSDREALDTLGETIAGIAHELNNPIGAGVTAASTIHRSVDSVRNAFDSGKLDTDGFSQFLNDTGEAAGILEENLLQAARLVRSFHETSVNQLSDKKSIILLKDLFKTIVLSQSHLLKRRKISIAVDIPDTIRIESYPGLITQMSVNLIANCLRHAFIEKDESNTISLSADETDEAVAIRFKDNGKGIPPETMSKIFESFFTTQRDSGGSGLGLYIVKDIVENQLSGTISVRSSVGIGTSFIIELPKS